MIMHSENAWLKRVWKFYFQPPLSKIRRLVEGKKKKAKGHFVFLHFHTWISCYFWPSLSHLQYLCFLKGLYYVLITICIMLVFILTNFKFTSFWTLLFYLSQKVRYSTHACNRQKCKQTTFFHHKNCFFVNKLMSFN